MRTKRAERARLARLQARCNAWNLANAVGVLVLLRRDNGELLTTRTRSPAAVLSGHSAVVWVHGIAGCYQLDRVTPAHRLKLDYR